MTTHNYQAQQYNDRQLTALPGPVSYTHLEQGAAAPGGFVGFMEMFIMMIHDDVIKSCVGPNYKKFAPYLLTAFFFIFINNIMGLIPFFPGGANVTGNIAITMVLAICTFRCV